MNQAVAVGDVKKLTLVQLGVFSLLVTLLVYLFAIFHPYSQPIEYGSSLPISALHGWVVLQSFWLILPALIIGCLVSLRYPRGGWFLGAAAITLSGMLFFVDVLAFNAFSERLLSSTTARILWVLLPGLVTNLNESMVKSGILMAVLMIGSLVLAGYLSRWVARRVTQDSRSSANWQSMLLCAALIAMLGAVPLWRADTTFKEMRTASDRHPLCATCLVGHNDQGVPAPKGVEALRGSVRALGTSQRIDQMEREYPLLSVNPLSTQSPDAALPDILMVVIESMRRETINPKTAPNLYELASKGIWARNHFSSSNATNMGMFSAFYGLESVWFERGRQMKPAITELFKQAGYETGFFGGSEHWDTFHMETFVNDQVFDEFRISPVGWIESDQEMCNLANQFLSASDSGNGQRKPRLAVLYIYSTHFDYRSEEIDRVHQPAVKGELTGTYGPATRDLIWNRYLNSVRCMDRLLSPLLTDDRVIAVIGDHGEAFLEDGCRLHGIKISEYQNATPAIIAGPGIDSRQLHVVTSHTDLLPTLLEAVGLGVGGPSLLEGHSLLDPDFPSDRLMVTRNYMRPEIAVLGSWTGQPGSPMGYRALFSLESWQAFAANPIDQAGFEIKPSTSTENASVNSLTSDTQRIFGQWLGQRFNSELAVASNDVIGDLAAHLLSPRPEVVLHALQLSVGVSPENATRLLPVVAQLTRSDDSEVRHLSQSVLIGMQRRMKN